MWSRTFQSDEHIVRSIRYLGYTDEARGIYKKKTTVYHSFVIIYSRGFPNKGLSNRLKFTIIYVYMFCEYAYLCY